MTDKKKKQCITFKQGDRVKINNRLGKFHRYGQTKNTTVVMFDEDGLGFCDEDNINYA